MDKVLHDTALELQKNWGIYDNLPAGEIPFTISEEAILKKLEERVIIFLERGADAFYQLMYRLDISEKKLNAIVANGENVALNIARLIYARQLQKIKSRLENKTPKPIEDDPDLKW